jgi:hypothetical protein
MKLVYRWAQVFVAVIAWIVIVPILELFHKRI